jgi:acid phosphatase
MSLSAIAAIVVGAFFAWLFSLEGSKGLGQWGWNTVYLAIAVTGALPLILSLAGLPWIKAGASRLGAGLSIASLVLSVIVTAGILILAGEIVTRAHHVAKPVPSLNLVDPSKGLVPSGPADATGQAVLRLSLSSDPHWGADTAYAEGRNALLKSVAAEQPKRDAFFCLGDNVQMGWNDAEWRAETTELAATLGNLPIRALIGNHDAIIDGEYHYKAYFFPPRLSSASGSPYYWSMDAGPAVIIALDLLWGAEDFSAKKAAWLEKTLAAVPAGKRIIVLSHCFFASSGYMDGSQPWFDHYGTLAKVAPILERYKVDLVVQGHNHYMELLERNGVTYATIGAMGGKPDPEPSHVSPWSKWFARGTFGYLNLDVTEAGIKLDFKDSAGMVVHSAYVPARK